MEQPNNSISSRRPFNQSCAKFPFRKLGFFLISTILMIGLAYALTVSDTGIDTSGGDINLTTGAVYISPPAGITPTIILASARGENSNGQQNRTALWFYNIQNPNISDDTFRSLAIETHLRNSNGTHPNHVTFYSPLNESGSPRALQWQWGIDSSGILEMPYFNRINFAEEFNGYYANQTNNGAGIESNDEQFIIYLDANSNQGGSTEHFAVKRNSKVSGGTYTFFTSEFINYFTGSLAIGTNVTPENTLDVQGNVSIDEHLMVGLTSPETRIDFNVGNNEGLRMNVASNNNAFIEIEEGNQHGGRILINGSANLIQIQAQLSDAFTNVISYSYANNGDIILGDSANQRNITMYSPDGTAYTCGVANGGTFSCG